MEEPNRVYAAIDPGVSGGVAVLQTQCDLTNQERLMMLHTMPVNFTGLIDDICCIRGVDNTTFFLEAPVFFHAGRGAATAISRIGKYLHQCGVLEGYIRGKGAKLNVVQAKEWQAYYEIKKEAGETTASWKKRIWDKVGPIARQKLPPFRDSVTNPMKDAIGILIWGIRRRSV